jgi:hypothetical protein
MSIEFLIAVAIGVTYLLGREIHHGLISLFFPED